MARKIPGKYGGTITPWEKGQSGNPSGNTRKYVSKLVDTGYTLAEINQTIQNLLAMKPDELLEVKENPDATALEKIITVSLLGSVSNGSIKAFEKLVNRAFGRPTESIEIKPPPTKDLDLNSSDPINALKRYQELMKQ